MALVIGGLVSGIVFAIVVKGPSTIAAWCIWGTGFFALGWVVVGLPLILLGERVRRTPYPLLVIAGGLGGAFAMALPAILFGVATPAAVHWKISFVDLRWEGIAFGIAAPVTALYRLFLDRMSSTNKAG